MDSQRLIDKYSDMIYHIAIKYLENEDDAQDIVQDVYLKYINYIKSGKTFNSEEHEKSWIIRVTMNASSNVVNSARKRKNVPLEKVLYVSLGICPENVLLETIKKLKDKYRVVCELYFVDRFKIAEISKILHITDANAKKRLSRAKVMIEKILEKGDNV